MDGQGRKSPARAFPRRLENPMRAGVSSVPTNCHLSMGDEGTMRLE
jgi:hypothetical protein